MADSLTRYAARLDAEARRLEKEVSDTRLVIQNAKIWQLEARIEQLTTIQDQLLETVMEQSESIAYLVRRDEALARAAGLSFRDALT